MKDLSSTSDGTTRRGKTIGVAAACVLVLAVLVGILFAYQHPFMPITSDDASACRLYRVSPRSPVATVQTLHGPRSANRLMYGRVWTAGLAVPCTPHVTDSVEDLLRDPSIYGRPASVGALFSPSYAYVLSGPSGTEIIMVDTGGGSFWFSVEKVSPSGRSVARVPLASDRSRGWLRLLKETVPNDPVVSQAWSEYQRETR